MQTSPCSYKFIDKSISQSFFRTLISDGSQHCPKPPSLPPGCSQGSSKLQHHLWRWQHHACHGHLSKCNPCNKEAFFSLILLVLVAWYITAHRREKHRFGAQTLALTSVTTLLECYSIRLRSTIRHTPWTANNKVPPKESSSKPMMSMNTISVNTIRHLFLTVILTQNTFTALSNCCHQTTQILPEGCILSSDAQVHRTLKWANSL